MRHARRSADRVSSDTAIADETVVAGTEYGRETVPRRAKVSACHRGVDLLAGNQLAVVVSGWPRVSLGCWLRLLWLTDDGVTGQMCVARRGQMVTVMFAAMRHVRREDGREDLRPILSISNTSCIHFIRRSLTHLRAWTIRRILHRGILTLCISTSFTT